MMKKEKTRNFLALIFLLSGVALIADAGYIHAKAWLGQKLMNNAWQNIQETQQVTKPWWWADTFPVATLFVPQHQARFLILHGASGEALAWGPGWLSSSAAPGESGNSIIAAHRDTHFRFLQHIQLGDQLIIENGRRQKIVYKVVKKHIVDIINEDYSFMLTSSDDRLLTLITCYPFDTLTTGNHQRFIVEARAIEISESEN